jgi:hypothetical protein
MGVETLTLLLLRESVLPTLEALLLTDLKDGTLREDVDRKPIARFLEVLKEALRWRVHGRDWILHGKQLAEEATVPLKVANREDVSYLDVLSYVEGLGRSYSWSLVPWGIQTTGLMIAFVSTDEDLSRKASGLLKRAFEGSLLVSSYQESDLRGKRFKGSVFKRSAQFRGHGVWQSGRGRSETAFALNFWSSDEELVLPAGAEVILEGYGSQFGNSVVRRWIRLRDESALLHLIQGDPPILVTSADLDERLMWMALQDFADVAEEVNQDALSFAVRAVKSASWIYIPLRDDAKQEIYINNDPTVTTFLMESRGVTSAPFFMHQFFL